MKKSIVTTTLLTSLLITTADADFIGAEAGIGYWNTKTSGDFRKGTTNIDLENDLKYGNSNNANTFYALIEHPVPLVPNFKIQHTKLSDSASTTLTKNINFKNKNYTANTQINSSYDLTQTDFIAYYEILDNWVNFDLGLNVKYLNGNVELNNATTTNLASEDFSLFIPMAYGKAQFDLPFTGLSAEAELSYIGYSSSHFYDAKVGVQYETSLGLGTEIGYREIQLKLDDIDDFYSNITTSGLYISLFYHF